MSADGARVVVRPLATPLPLTFLGLMIATTVVAGSELGWIPAAERHDVGWVVLAVPFPMQLVASVLGFATRSAAAATGSAVLAGTWLGVALDLLAARPGPSGPTAAVGTMLLASSAALLVPVAAELKVGALLPAGVMLTSSVRFLVTGVDGLVHSPGLTTASGAVGLVLAAVALYGALALELEDSLHQALLPTFRVGSARDALTAPLVTQLDEVEHAAGVRGTL